MGRAWTGWYYKQRRGAFTYLPRAPRTSAPAQVRRIPIPRSPPQRSLWWPSRTRTPASQALLLGPVAPVLVIRDASIWVRQRSARGGSDDFLISPLGKSTPPQVMPRGWESVFRLTQIQLSRSQSRRITLWPDGRLLCIKHIQVRIYTHHGGSRNYCDFKGASPGSVRLLSVEQLLHVVHNTEASYDLQQHYQALC